MEFYIKKLCLYNIFTFRGNNIVKLKKFNTIMCNFYEGKRDFMKALHFLFGAELCAMGHESANDIVHKPVGTTSGNDDSTASVAALVYFPREGRYLELKRYVAYGRLEHAVDEEEVSEKLYIATLKTMNLFIIDHPLFMENDLINTCIWGEAEDLEEMMSFFLRQPYFLQVIKEQSQEVKSLENKEKRLKELNYLTVEKDHKILDSVATGCNPTTILMKKLEDNLTLAQSICFGAEEGEVFSSDESLSQLTLASAGENASVMAEDAEIADLQDQISRCEEKELTLRNTVANMTGLLYHNELRTARKTKDLQLLKRGRVCIRSAMLEIERRLPVLNSTLKEMEADVVQIGLNIAHGLAQLNDMAAAKGRQRRITTYGRLIDYVKPSKHMELLERSLGMDLLYGNLVEESETAVECVKKLREWRQEDRELFIILNYFNPKLKHLILSTKGGIDISDLMNVQTFLCKLKQYELIETVPMLVTTTVAFGLPETFMCNNEGTPDSAIFFLQTGVLVQTDGLISARFKTDEKFMTSDELLSKVNQEIQVQESLYNGIRNSYQQKCISRQQISYYEADVAVFKSLEDHLARFWSQSTASSSLPPLDNIYLEYRDIFDSIDTVSERVADDMTQHGGTNAAEANERVEHSDRLVKQRQNCLELVKELNELRQQIELLTLRDTGTQQPLLTDTAFSRRHVPEVKGADTSVVDELGLQKIFRLVLRENFEEFANLKEWRASLLSALCEELKDVKGRLKRARGMLMTVCEERIRVYQPFLEHCQLYLKHMFNEFLPSTLFNPTLRGFHTPCAHLELVSLLRGAFVTTGNFGTFINFAAVFCMLLQGVQYKKAPLIIMEGIDDYFPETEADVTTVLGAEWMNQVLANPDDSYRARFDLIMTFSRTLHNFILQNSRCATDEVVAGPMQVFVFSNRELFSPKHNPIWIKAVHLDDEESTANCDTVSNIVNVHIPKT